MVNYGKSLQQARRMGWENAYLDYNGLKQIIEKMESLLWSRDSERVRLLESGTAGKEERPTTTEIVDGQEILAPELARQVENLKQEFFLKLKVEIEKVSLFSLTKQGQLADAVGATRFDVTELFNINAVASSFQSVIVRTTSNNSLETFGVLSVELAHVLKFICINAVGIQKILKKYNKIFEKMDEPHHYFVENDHLRQLANSQSIMAIHASLQAVLDECYQRENIRQAQTALALLRFQSAMECTAILRRSAGLIQLPFVDFLSKKSMIVSNTDFGGMDGASQRALKWLLKLEPQTILQKNQVQLERMWKRWSSETEYVHAHLNGGLPYGHRRIRTYTGQEALEAMMSQDATQDLTQSKWAWGGVNKISMILNLLSILLYTINYYIVAPTANHYAISLGLDGAFGATLIGASSLSALFSAFVYSLWYTRSTFRSALIFSAACPLVGNLIYALAISYSSMPMAIAGRILCGFGSAEVLNRQMISTCVRFDDMTQASALFVAFGACGMSIGPLLAGILDIVAGRDEHVDLELPFTPVGGIVYNHNTAPGFVMAGLWLLQLAGLLFFFLEPIRINNSEYDNKDNEGSDGSEHGSSRNGSYLDLTRLGSDASTDRLGYGSLSMSDNDIVEPYPNKIARCLGPQDLWDEIVSTWNLVFQSAGLPITLLIFSYIEMADEVIISSCSMVVRRYFGWHGSMAGFFIAALGSLVIPAHFVVEMASHHISERKILLRSLVAIVICIFGIFNYSGLMYDVLGTLFIDEEESDDLVKEVKLNGNKVKKILTIDGEIFYNWGYGVVFYVIFLSLLFMSTIVLEGVDTSIMAKVTPPKLNEKFINGGLLATLIGTLGRVVADSILTVCALLDINIFVDFVNETFLPVLLLALVGIILVTKYYKQLV